MRSVLLSFSLVFAVQTAAHAGRRAGSADQGRAASEMLAGRWKKVRGAGPATLRIIDLGRGGVSVEGRDDRGVRTHWEIIDRIGEPAHVHSWDNRRTLGSTAGTETTTTAAHIRGTKVAMTKRLVTDRRWGVLDTLVGLWPERSIEKVSLATDGTTLHLRSRRDWLHLTFRLFGDFTSRAKPTEGPDKTEYVRTAPREWP